MLRWMSDSPANSFPDKSYNKQRACLENDRTRALCMQSMYADLLLQLLGEVRASGAYGGDECAVKCGSRLLASGHLEFAFFRSGGEYGFLKLHRVRPFPHDDLARGFSPGDAGGVKLSLGLVSSLPLAVAAASCGQQSRSSEQ